MSHNSPLITCPDCGKSRCPECDPSCNNEHHDCAQAQTATAKLLFAAERRAADLEAELAGYRERERQLIETLLDYGRDAWRRCGWASCIEAPFSRGYASAAWDTVLMVREVLAILDAQPPQERCGGNGFVTGEPIGNVSELCPGCPDCAKEQADER